MTSDRELLEKAARAAGIEGDLDEHPVSPYDYPDRDSTVVLAVRQSNGDLWSPLTDDGDCARMEATLGISIDWDFAGSVMAVVWRRNRIQRGARIENGDRNAARRLAAVRAAAAIAPKEQP